MRKALFIIALLALSNACAWYPNMSVEYVTQQIRLASQAQTPSEVTPDGDALLETMLRLAIAYNENVMGEPVPTQTVQLHIVPTLPGTATSMNYSTHIEIRESHLTSPPQVLLSTLTHEVAHYWWHYEPTWFSEGLASYTEFRATGLNFERKRLDGCPMSIARQYEEEYEHEGDRRCAYYVGAAFWADLHATSPDTFNASLRKLHDLYTAGTTGPEAIELAFGSHVPRSVLVEVYNRER